MFAKQISIALGAVLLAAAGSSPAHHSFAMFDLDKTVTISGTVRAFEWTNPHVWLWVNVTNEQGVVTVWGLEGTAPGELVRQGWSRDSIRKGEKLTVNLRPLKDGRNGGTLGRITFADGRTLGGAPERGRGAPGPRSGGAPAESPEPTAP